MSNTYEIYLVSDSTGETLDRIFLALKAQFSKIKYKTYQFSFTRTENQVLKIIDICKKKQNCIILYTIVDTKLAKFLTVESEKIKKDQIYGYEYNNLKIINNLFMSNTYEIVKQNV